MADYSKYRSRELIQIIGTAKRIDKDINIEWRKRYGLNAPYQLTSDGLIKNCLLDALVADRECDKIILNQANEIRNKVIGL